MEKPAEARLRELSQRHAIDFEPLRQKLANADDQQNRLIEIAESHSCELAGWEAIVSDLDQRQSRAIEAVERLSAELLEVDGAFFQGHPVDDCQAMLGEIRRALERALTARVESARFVRALGNAAREPTHPDGALVTATLRELTAALTTGEHGESLGKEDALAVVATLAQVCGVLDASLDDPSAALAQRLATAAGGGTDLEALFLARQSAADTRLEPGLSFEEIARRAQAMALGLWPDEPERS